MHRFHLAPEKATGPILVLEGNEAHHAISVVRVRTGQTILILDGSGHQILAEIESVQKKSLQARVIRREAAPVQSHALTLLQAVPKGKTMDAIIQKATELGVDKIVPILTSRTECHFDQPEAKREKWQGVAIEAMKQSGLPWLPRIEVPQPLELTLRQKSTAELQLVGSLQKDRRHPRLCFDQFRLEHGRPPASVAVWIGPEGDFTPEELSAILAGGAQPITLGQYTLRCETAALYALSLAHYELSAR